MKIIIPDLETLPGWERHVTKADTGGNPPEEFTITQWPECTRFHIKGGAYSNGLAALHLPLMPTTGHLTLTFELMTDVLAYQFAQAIEFDTRISVNQLNYNFSVQINYAIGGRLQISDAAGGWVDTNYVPGKLVAGLWYPVKCKYAFDTNMHLYQTEEVRIGSGTGVERYEADPVKMIEPTDMGWSDSCSLQIQQDLGKDGGEFSIYVRKAQYEWR